MRQWLWAPLVGVLVLGVTAPTATAGTNPEAVIGLHVVSMEQATGTCEAFLPNSCTQFSTNVSAPGEYYLYVTVARYDTVGIAGLQFGVKYDPTANSGFDVTSWYSCGDLNFPMVGWPNSETGTLMTWEPTQNCKGEDRLRDKPICAGVFQVYANGQDDAFKITPRPADGKAKVADCQSAEDDITNASPSRLGIVTFGSGGYNPCVSIVPVEPTTWGAIKTLYER